MRLAVVVSHPVQYYAPVFRALAQRANLSVYYTQTLAPQQQAAAGFGTAFDWDVDLFGGYQSHVLINRAKVPGPSRFAGADTPEIGARLDAARPDAVLVMGWYLKALVQAILAAKRRRIPVILRGDNQLGMPGNAPKRLIRTMALPALLRRFEAAAYVGEKNRTYYETHRYPAARLFHSPHAVDTARFAAGATREARQGARQRLGVGETTNLVLFAGKLVDFKRPLDALAMVAELRRSGMDAALAVAGSGPLEETLAHQARAAAVPLHLMGFQNQSQMPAAYAAADALILPSTRRETWGLVANEALASGTPVVVSDAAGCAPDVTADDHVGRAYPMADVAAGARALAQTLSEPPSAAAIKAVSERFSIARAADGIMRAARSVAQPEGR